jgi:hypothetical protein
VAWTPDGTAGGAWAAAVDGADAVVNLSGADMAGGRWTAARKRLLRDSRLQSTSSLVTAVRAARTKPRVFVQGSAVGVYGASLDDLTLDEASPPGTDFLASMAADWEATARPVGDTCRLVFIRTGIVLSRKGGALKKMLLPFQLFAGGPVASGRQYLSWIHLDDWVGLVTWALEDEAVRGPVNASAPNPVTSAEFARALGRALHRPAWAPVPGFVLTLVFGEMAHDMLMLGQRVLPRRAMELGYRFRYERIDEAMVAAVRR